MTPSFSMQYHWTMDDMLGYFSSWSAVQHYIKLNGRDPVQLLRPELQKAWGNDQYKMIRFPLFMRVGRKK
jgi:hypothetical protein